MTAMTIHEIRKLLPHAYPFLLIDRVMECVPGDHLLALKNVTFNEPFFQGHFPHRPIMPGVLLIEAMAQASSILGLKTLNLEPGDNTLYYLVGVDRSRFKKPVEPGDQLMISVGLEKNVRGIARFDVSVTVDDDVVASALITAAARAAEA